MDPVKNIILSTKDETLENILSPYIREQFPSFMREDYSKLVLFIKAYYEWLDQQGNAGFVTFNLDTLTDIDKNLEEFMDHFRNTYLVSFPTELAVDENGNKPNKKTLLKKIRDFYGNKGTESAYKFLFRILYNSNLEIYYPKSDILRVSDGQWIEPRSVKTTSYNGTALFGGKNGQLVQYSGTNVSASAFIDNVIQYNFNGNPITEFFVNEINGDFLPDRTIRIVGASGEWEESVYSVLGEFFIEVPGSGYRIGDSVTVLAGVTGSGFSAKVDQVGLGGSIKRISIANSGLEYAENAIVNIFSETGSQSAKVVALRSAVTKYPGYFAGNRGKISSNKSIQDGNYYQEFSYELKSVVSLDTYFSVLKSIIHPAGMKMFGSILVKEAIANSLQSAAQLYSNENPLIGTYTPYTTRTFNNLRAGIFLPNQVRGATLQTWFSTYSVPGNTSTGVTADRSLLTDPFLSFGVNSFRDLRRGMTFSVPNGNVADGTVWSTPRFEQEAVNTHPSLVFRPINESGSDFGGDGNSANWRSYGYWAGITVGALGLSAARSYFVVAKGRTATTMGAVGSPTTSRYLVGDANGYHGIIIGKTGSTQTLRAVAYNLTTSSPRPQVIGTIGNVGEWFILCNTYNGVPNSTGSLSLFVNGVCAGTQTSAGLSTGIFTANANKGVSLGFGMASGIDSVFDGEIAEVLCYQGDVGEADRLKIEGYLAHKYNLVGKLPSTHPYKTSPPGSSFANNQGKWYGTTGDFYPIGYNPYIGSTAEVGLDGSTAPLGSLFIAEPLLGYTYTVADENGITGHNPIGYPLGGTAAWYAGKDKSHLTPGLLPGLVLWLKPENIRVYRNNLVVPYTNAAAGYTGHGSSLVLQPYKYLGYPVYRNTVTNPGAANNFGLVSVNTVALNQSGVKSLVLTFFTNVVVSPTIIGGYVTVKYTDTSTENHTWSYSPSNWHTTNLGEWKEVTATVTLNPSKTPESIIRWYVYRDNATEGTMDVANVVIEQRAAGAYYTNGASFDMWYDESGKDNHAIPPTWGRFNGAAYSSAGVTIDKLRPTIAFGSIAGPTGVCFNGGALYAPTTTWNGASLAQWIQLGNTHGAGTTAEKILNGQHIYLTNPLNLQGEVDIFMVVRPTVDGYDRGLGLFSSDAGLTSYRRDDTVLYHRSYNPVDISAALQNSEYYKVLPNSSLQYPSSLPVGLVGFRPSGAKIGTQLNTVAYDPHVSGLCFGTAVGEWRRSSNNLIESFLNGDRSLNYSKSTGRRISSVVAPASEDYIVTDSLVYWINSSKSASIGKLAESQQKNILNSYLGEFQEFDYGGPASLIPSGYGIYGVLADNSIVALNSIDPWGQDSLVWRGKNTSGFNLARVPIDPTQTYRFCVWVNRSVAGDGLGNRYSGVYGYNSSGGLIGVQTRRSSALTVNTNFYFESRTNTASDVNKWYLIVSHVHPAGSGYSATDHPDSGVYLANGTKISLAHGDAVWLADVRSAVFRSYMTGGAADAVRTQLWLQPRLDLVDGSEPTVTELLQNRDNYWDNLVTSHTPLTIAKNYPTYTQVSDTLKYVSFDGKNDHLIIGHPELSVVENGTLDLQNNATYTGPYRKNLFTMEMLLRPTKYNTFLLGVPYNGSDNYLTYAGDRISVVLVQRVDTAVASVISTPNSVPLNRWTHFVLQIDGRNVKIYINGKLDVDTTVNLGWIRPWDRETAQGTVESVIGPPPDANATMSSTASWHLGMRSAYTGQLGGSYTSYRDLWFQGDLADFRIYNRILSSLEIMRNFNSVRGFVGI